MLRGLAGIPGVRCEVSDGTFYCLPDFSALTNDSVALAELLLEKALVATVPGREFGADGHLRLSYAGSAEEIAEGVARIRWVVDPSASREIRIGERTILRDWT
jgi:aspartate aminotransferase